MKKVFIFLLCSLMLSLSAQVPPKGQTNSGEDQQRDTRDYHYPSKVTFDYPNVVDYIVVFGDNQDLPKKVMEKIKQGWKLYGTPFGRTGSAWVYQALVKLQ